MDLLYFLAEEKAKIALPPEWGAVLMGLEALFTGEVDLTTTKFWGEQQECDFQFCKSARRKSRKLTPLPLRLHGRVYIDENEIIVVTHTETDPREPVSWIFHLTEEVAEYHVIRLGRK